MPQIGPLELVLVLVIALLLLGPKRLPAAAQSLGRGINEFRRGLTDHGGDRSANDELSESTEPSAPGAVRVGSEPASPAATDPASVDPDTESRPR